MASTVVLFLIFAWFDASESLVRFVFSKASAKGLEAQVLSRHGRVLARGLELRGGKPIWVEIDEQGEPGKEIGVASGNLEKAQAMEAAQYRAYGELLKNIKEQFPDLTQGAYILTDKEYKSQNFGSVNVPVSNTGPNQASTISVAIPKPELKAQTKSVLIRATETIIDPRLLPTEGPIILQAPINLKAGVYQQLADNSKTVLVNNDGILVHESPHNIGFKNGFFHSDDAGQQGDPLGPVKGAKVEAPGMMRWDIHSVTGADGKYQFEIFKPSCPGFTFTHNFNVTATFAMRNFHPEAGDFIDVGWAGIPDHTSCSGISELLSAFFSPVEAAVKSHIESIELGLAMSNVQSGTDIRNIYVDSTMFAGAAKLIDIETGQALSQSETKYQYQAPNMSRIQTPNLDLDLDRRDDFVILNGDQLSVYLRAVGTNGAGQPIDANGNVITEPDLIRVADIAPDFTNQGLLESISKEDLKKTDLYIFRMSNGLLVAKRTELDDLDLDIVGDDHFAYRFPIPGSRFSDLCSGGSCGGIALQNRAERREAWQDAQNIAQELRPFKSDHLHPGEKIKIIAINRPTGYIGSTIATVSPPANGRLDVATEKLIMRPPNLKITTERIYTVKSRTDEDKDEQRIVGFEGSALTNDTRVQIHTEWLDHDGTALPEALEGYTGRLAKTTSNNSLEGGDVSTFEIKPGSHLQIVKFKGDILGNEHFYLHVSGYSQWQNPGVGAASSGPLQYRPKNYVPIKVPIYDEVSTRLMRNLNSYNEQAGQPFIENVPAVYQWPYRPEMQFSVFSFKLNRVRTETDSGIERIIDLTQDQNAILNEILADNIELIEIFYNLAASDNDGLDWLGSPRELIFAIGEEEVPITVNSNGSITFDHPEHIDLLTDLDYAILRLYQNSDAENILWELMPSGLFAFYRAPDPENRISQDSASTADEILYRVLGGMRIRLAYEPTPDEQVLSYQWTIPNGRFYESYQADAVELSKPSEPEVYWEFNEWKVDQTSEAKLNLTVLNKDNVIKTRTEKFKLVTRTLRPTNPVMEGSDVAMLEELFWQIGMSPQDGFPGSQGNRIDSIAKTNGVDLHKSRDKYSTTPFNYVSAIRRNNTDALRQEARTASLVKMVRRFQGRHVAISTSANDARISAGRDADGIVNDVVLSKLKIHYDQYLKAYNAYQNSGVIRVDDLASHSDLDVWINNALAVFDQTSTHFSPSYTQAVHAGLLEQSETVTRTDVLRAWIQREAFTHGGRSYFWGHGYPQTNFRVVVGGADEWGSIGFNQILFQYTYGANGVCPPVSGENMYHPNTNMEGFAHWLHRPSSQCGGSFQAAFVGNAFDDVYNNTNAIIRLRGYRRGSGGTYTAITSTDSYTDDNYEKLTRGIMGYNAGIGLVDDFNWFSYLINTNAVQQFYNAQQRTKINHATDYAIHVKQDAGLLLRTYVLEAQNVQNQWVCFTYNESDKLTGISWQAARDDAARHVDCLTGN